MIFVAIAALLLVGVLIYMLREQIRAANQRETEMRLQLLSVLGKTETVALTFKDKRPVHGIEYVDDEEAVRLERMTDRDET
jgi:hypothetical protein